MKVNFGSLIKQVTICELKVGDTFIATRTKKELGEAIYMLVDGNSGLIRKNPARRKYYAVNLDSGQLREFDYNYIVKPKAAVVNVEA